MENKCTCKDIVINGPDILRAILGNNCPIHLTNEIKNLHIKSNNSNKEMIIQNSKLKADKIIIES